MTTNTISIYANYGVLAHEKLPVYSETKGDISEQITVKLPEGVMASKNAAGQTIVTVPYSKYTYTLPEILTNTETGKPCLRYINSSGSYSTIVLEVVDE